MNGQPLHILSHARSHMIEMIMALIGRSSSDPVRYRRLLEGSDTETLQRKLQVLADGHRETLNDFSAPEAGSGMTGEFRLSLPIGNPAHAFHSGESETRSTEQNPGVTRCKSSASPLLSEPEAIEV